MGRTDGKLEYSWFDSFVVQRHGRGSGQKNQCIQINDPPFQTYLPIMADIKHQHQPFIFFMYSNVMGVKKERSITNSQSQTTKTTKAITVARANTVRVKTTTTSYRGSNKERLAHSDTLPSSEHRIRSHPTRETKNENERNNKNES